MKVVCFFSTVVETTINVGSPRGGTESTTKDIYGGMLFMLILFFVSLSLNIIEKLSSIPEFAHLGPIFKSSSPVDLTESEVEYVVRCIKHVFSHYIVFQVKHFFHPLFFQNYFSFSLI